VEVTGEGRLASKFGLAGVVGVGSIEGDLPDPSGNVRTEIFSVWEIGASARYYLLGDFDHGMQLGAEVLYVNVDVEGENVSGTGAGTALGPFIGYKVSADFGLTFDSQLGFQFVVGRVEAESGGAMAEGEANAVVPLLNLNLGWAF
jgi:hypothetical protein